MKKLLFSCLMVSIVAASNAVSFLDTFNGNTNPVNAGQAFASGATTGFSFWAIGTSGDMDAGFFSVVNKAIDVHSQFHSSLDADNDVNGRYAVYNGFQSVDGLAYSKVMSGLVIGEQYSIDAMFITLAPDPPYNQVSNLRFELDGSALGSDFTLTPVALGSEFWTDYGRTFIATSTSHTLSIKNIGGASNAGNDFGIDNVRIQDAPVPEPATMTAMALGAAAMLRRRKASR